MTYYTDVMGGKGQGGDPMDHRFHSKDSGCTQNDQTVLHVALKVWQKMFWWIMKNA